MMSPTAVSMLEPVSSFFGYFSSVAVVNLCAKDTNSSLKTSLVVL